MRAIHLIGSSAALVASLLVNQAYAAAKIGEPAPDFRVAGADGNAHALSDYRGRFVVLEWSNADCPFVRKHYGSGNMQALQQQATADGVVWLTVISSAPGKQGHVDAAEAQRLTEKRKAAPSAVLLDESGTALARLNCYVHSISACEPSPEAARVRIIVRFVDQDPAKLQALSSLFE